MLRARGHPLARSIAAAATAALVVLGGAQAASAAPASSLSMLHRSGATTASYLYAPGESVVPTATGLGAAKTYRYQVFSPDGTPLDQSACFDKGSVPDYSYALPTTAPPSGGAGYRLQITAFAAAACSGTVSVDAVRYFDVLNASVSGGSVSGPFNPSQAAQVAVTGAVNRDSLKGTATAVSTASGWSVAWLRDGAQVCANNADDRPPSTTDGIASPLRMPPNAADPSDFNQPLAYEVGSCTFLTGTYSLQLTLSATQTATIPAFSVDATGPTPSITSGPSNPTDQNAPALAGSAGTQAASATAFADNPSVTVHVYSGTDTTGTLVRTISRPVSAGSWSLSAADWDSSDSDHTPLPDGTYTVQVDQSDAGGNTGHSGTTRTFTVDRTGPAVTLTTPGANADVNDATPTMSGAAGNTATDLAAVTLKIYSGSSAGGTPFRTVSATKVGDQWTVGDAEWGTQALPKGTYTAVAEQSDSLGNLGQSRPVTFRVDLTAPGVTLTSPDDGAAIRDSSPAISGAADTTAAAADASADSQQVTVRIYSGPTASGSAQRTFTVSRSGGSWSVGAGDWSATTPLGQGQYTVQAEQRDGAGNVGLSTLHTFRIDQDTPISQASAPQPATNGNSIEVDYTASDPGASSSGIAQVQLWAKVPGGDGSFHPVAGANSTTTSGSFQYDTTGKAEGRYFFATVVTDNSGNAEAAPTGSGDTLVHLDRTQPAVTLNSVPSPGRGTQPAMSGSAGSADGSGEPGADLGTITVDVYSGSSVSGSAARTITVTRSGGSWSLGSGDWDDNISAKAHLGDGTWTAVARQDDAAGNHGSSDPRTFKVDSQPPAVTLAARGDSSAAKPALSGSAGAADGSDPAVAADSGTVTVDIWSGNSVSGSPARSFNVTRTGGAWSLPASAYDGSTSAHNPLPDGTWTVRARQDDGAGNTGTSTPATFKVDHTAPAVGFDAPSPLTNDSTPSLSGAAGSADGSALDSTADSGSVTVELWHGSGTTGPADRTLSAIATGGTWSIGDGEWSGHDALTEGDWTARATQTDAVGNSGHSDLVHFTVDLTAPAVNVTLSAVDGDGGWYRSQPTVHAAVSDAHPGSLACTVDGSAVTLSNVASDGSSADVPVSGDGSHAVSCTATDGAGNQGSDSASFKVDSTDPTAELDITPADPDGTNDFYTAAPTVKLTAADAHLASSACTVDGTAVTIAGDGTVPVSGDGSHDVRCSAHDEAGNSGSAERTVKIDEHDPAVTMDAPAAVTGDATPALTGDAGTDPGDHASVTVELWQGSDTTGTPDRSIDATPSGGRWTLDGSAWSGHDPLTEGDWTARVAQADDAGRTGSAERGFSVDLTKPAVAVSLTPSTAAGDNGWYLATPSVHLDATDAHLASTSCTVDGSPVDVTADGTVPVSGDGSHTVHCRATDSAGNSSDDSKDFKVDTTDPIVHLTRTPADPDGSNDFYRSQPAVQVDASDAHLNDTRCTVDGSAVSVGGDGSVPVSGDGPHSVHCTATDDAGRSTSDDTSFKVDSYAPQPTTDAPADGDLTADPTPAVAGSGGTDTGDDDHVEVSIDGGSPVAANVAGDGSWSLTPTALSDGSHTIAVTQDDSAGNSGSAPVVTFTVDTTRPDVAIAPAPASPDGSNGWYTSAPALHASASDANIDKLDCTADGSAVTLASPSSDATHRAGDIAISGDGRHSVACTAADGAGNSRNAQASIDLDAHAPTISSANDGQAYTQGQSVAADIHCDDPSGGSGVASCAGDLAGPALDTATPGAHSFHVSARDRAGNEQTRTINYTVSQQHVEGEQHDLTPPKLGTGSTKLTQALTGGAIGLDLTCDEVCNLAATGTVSVPGAAKVYRLKTVRGALKKAGGHAKLKLKLGGSALKAVRQAIKRDHKVTAKVTVTATDASGNKRPRTLSIRIRKA